MAKELTFDQAKQKYSKKLELFVPTVAKVHGAHHPEFHDVHKIYDEIVKKTEEAGLEKPELNEEFAKLREITDNYTVPGDVCETYEAVYNILAEIEEAYKA